MKWKNERGGGLTFLGMLVFIYNVSEIVCVLGTHTYQTMQI